MKLKCVLVLLILLLSMACTAHGAEEKLKIKNSDGEEVTRDTTPKKSVTLEDAVSLNAEMENAGVLSDKDDEDEENEEEDAPEKSYNYEIVEDEDYIRNEVAAGNKQFLTGLLTDIYTEFQNSSVKDEHGNTAGMIYTAVTFVPNPYENNTIVELYGGYVNLCIFLTVMFILGESVNRSAARMRITSSSKYSIPPRRLVGGACHVHVCNDG